MLKYLRKDNRATYERVLEGEGIRPTGMFDPAYRSAIVTVAIVSVAKVSIATGTGTFDPAYRSAIVSRAIVSITIGSGMFRPGVQERQREREI